MASPDSSPLDGLFSSRPGPAESVSFSVLRKAGEPFLYLPRPAQAAACAMRLYPAQTPVARLAKAVLRAAFQGNLPVPLERTTLPMDTGHPFVRFLSKLSGTKPVVAILAGNPEAEGRRFTILVFAGDGTPRAVVKAGTTAAARALVEREESFLRSVPESLRRGLPVVREGFSSDEVRAMVLDYVAGDSPRGPVRERLASMLGSWLDTNGETSLSEIPVWQRLVARCEAEHSFLAELGSRRVVPAMMHGDFAPWNVKVSPRDGAWTVLDWELGERMGVPGWDWFHFEIQHAVLVRRWPVAELSRLIVRLLESAEFRDYATRARIAEIARPLAAAYLLYCVEIWRPTAGLERLRSLLAEQLALARGEGRR